MADPTRATNFDPDPSLLIATKTYFWGHWMVEGLWCFITYEVKEICLQK